jgi:hypothetical protein
VKLIRWDSDFAHSRGTQTRLWDAQIVKNSPPQIIDLGVTGIILTTNTKHACFLGIVGISSVRHNRA